MIKLRLAVFLPLLLILPLVQAETLIGRVVRITDGDTPACAAVLCCFARITN